MLTADARARASAWALASRARARAVAGSGGGGGGEGSRGGEAEEGDTDHQLEEREAALVAQRLAVPELGHCSLPPEAWWPFGRVWKLNCVCHGRLQVQCQLARTTTRHSANGARGVLRGSE